MSESSSSERPPASVQRRGPSNLFAVVSAGLVFIAFVVYGRLAPTTYLATAQVIVTSADGAPPRLPSVPTPAERLRRAAEDAQGLRQVAAELKLGSGPSAETLARQQLEGSFKVRATTADTFELSIRSSTAEGATKLANLLALHAAQQASSALRPPPPDEALAREAARNKSAAELAAFMAKHPELTPGPVVAPVTVKENAEPDFAALRAERDHILAKLAHTQEGSASSDNPFGEPAAPSAELVRMRRRLTEIEQTLSGRRRTDRAMEAKAKVAPEVDLEWKRLLKAVAEPVVGPESTTQPALRVMWREAQPPKSPIDPDRRMLAIFGGLASLVTAALLSISQTLLRRRGKRHNEATDSSYGLEAGTGRPGSEPPRPGSEPPRPGSEPPRPGSEPPKPGSNPPRPILAVESTSIGPAGAPGSDPRRSSSNPPARSGGSSQPPPPATGSSSPPPQLPTKTGYAAPSPPPPPPVPTAAGYSAPSSPPPPAPSPASPRPTPAYDGGLGQRPASGQVPKGTLVGMAPLDPRMLAATLPSAPAERSVGKRDDEPFAVAPSTREPNAPRSTLRPPPPDTPNTPLAETMTVTATHQPPDAGPGDDWTGPSRAHRRSMSTARRTTQILGSPIPPVTRGSGPPPAKRTGDGRSTPVPASPSTTGYSYVSSRPPAVPAVRQVDTPPYYQSSHAEDARSRPPPSTPSPPAPSARAPAKRPRVTKQPVRTGWSPIPGLDPNLRRALSNDLLPLAIDGCLVIGVTGLSEVRAQKSRVAAELALALAEPQHPRVLLLEGDFQWAAVHQVMRIEVPMSAGFSQQLGALGKLPSSAWTVTQVSPTLHVLAESLMRSPGLILSMQFEESIRSLRAYYDLIVIDGPDTSSEAECRAFASAIDGVVLVAPIKGAPELARATALFHDKRYSIVVGV